MQYIINSTLLRLGSGFITPTHFTHHVRRAAKNENSRLTLNVPAVDGGKRGVTATWSTKWWNYWLDSNQRVYDKKTQLSQTLFLYVSAVLRHTD